MSRGSAQLTEARKEEIIAACAALYEEKGFKDTTIKDIGEAITLTRTGIYIYFETKEEIFLALLGREYDAWVSEMREIMARKTAMTRNDVAEVLAGTLTNHPRLLRLLSMNLYEMEANSRLERLVEFKKSFGASLETVDQLLQQYIPDINEDQRRKFIYAFFPFIYGIYPYTSVTEKQMAAMREAGIPYQYQSAFELTFACAKKLLEV
ncbi:MAG: TetR family transcriptional regulator [Clostridia bacterium]|nr:TetR family transcriptional regulator [Clostridia bacterium]MBR7175208.1 TetR family transcriptional regulator [Clostridia bacterium]